MLVSEFNFELPAELIAQEPLPDRSASRLLHLERGAAARDRCFRDFPELLRPDDLVVFNNTRVLPARLYGRRRGVKAQPVSPRNPAAREFLKGLDRKERFDANKHGLTIRCDRIEEEVNTTDAQRKSLDAKA